MRLVRRRLHSSSVRHAPANNLHSFSGLEAHTRCCPTRLVTLAIREVGREPLHLSRLATASSAEKSLPWPFEVCPQGASLPEVLLRHQQAAANFVPALPGVPADAEAAGPVRYVCVSSAYAAPKFKLWLSQGTQEKLGAFRSLQTAASRIGRSGLMAAPGCIGGACRFLASMKTG